MITGEEAFKQTVTVPMILAAGVGRTVIVAEPVIVLEQLGAVW